MRRFLSRSSAVLQAPPRNMGGRSVAGRAKFGDEGQEFTAFQQEVSNITGGMDTAADIPDEGFVKSKRYSRDPDFDNEGGDSKREAKTNKYPKEFRDDGDDGNFDFGKKLKYEDRRPLEKKQSFGGFDKKPFDRERGDGGGFDRERNFDKKPFDRERGGGGGFDRERNFDKKPFDRERGGGGGFDRERNFDKKPFDRERGGGGGFDRERNFDKKPFDRERNFDKKPFDRERNGGFDKKPFDRERNGDFDKKPFDRERNGGSFDKKKPFEASSGERSTERAQSPPRKASKPPAFMPEPKPPRRVDTETAAQPEEDESQFTKLVHTSNTHEFIYGRHSVQTALTYMDDTTLRTACRLICHSQLEETFDLIKLARTKQVPVERSSKMRMGDAVGPQAAKLHDGVILEIPRLEYTTIKKETVVRTPKPVDDTTPAPITLMLALDEIVDPTNLASILRSAHYFGVYTVLASEKNSAPLSPLVTHASRGASIVLSETNRLLGTKNLATALQAHKRNGWRVVGTSASAVGERVVSVDALDLKSNPKTILLMGSEQSGLRESVKQECDYFVHLARPERVTPTAQPSSHAAAVETDKLVAEDKIALNVSAATAALLAMLLK